MRSIAEPHVECAESHIESLTESLTESRAECAEALRSVNITEVMALSQIKLLAGGSVINRRLHPLCFISKITLSKSIGAIL